MAKKRKKKKSERQRNLEGYKKALEILTKHPCKRLHRGRYYGNQPDGSELSCAVGLLGTHFKFSATLRENPDLMIERFPSGDLQKFGSHIPIAVLTEIQMENDWRFEDEMTSAERYTNMVCFLHQKIRNLLDPTKVTLAA